MIVQSLIETINGLLILVHGESLTEQNEKDLEKTFTPDELETFIQELKFELTPFKDIGH